MGKLDSYIDSKIIQNSFVWIFLFIILAISLHADNRATVALYVVLLLAPVSYVNNILILPYIRKNIGLFFLFFLVNVTIFTTMYLYIFLPLNTGESDLRQFVKLFGIMTLSMSFASALKLARDSFMRRHKENEAELKLLKAQLNPHFLFNTLNNLYGLSVVKSDKLPDLMLKLSNLLRYSLYDTKDSLVPLEKEIDYLENYMSLERIRLEDKANIQLEKSGKFTDKKIVPMLLIVFVENAFKHLHSEKDEKNSVMVSLKTIDSKIYFRCVNSKDSPDSKANHTRNLGGGIGLQNVKKRLALLYPDNHSLNITQNKNTFEVDLMLQ